jgi:hypothetical protein
VAPLKPQKIDLQQSYPCPSCLGKLQPIALTEALGCDRCHLIFVIADEQNLMQLGGVGRYYRAWHWLGDRWQLNGSSKYSEELRRRGFILVFSLFLITLPLLGWLIATQQSVLLLMFMTTILLLAVSWGFMMSHPGDF